MQSGIYLYPAMERISNFKPETVNGIQPYKGSIGGGEWFSHAWSMWSIGLGFEFMNL